MLEHFYPHASIDRVDLLDISGEGRPSVMRTSWSMAGVTSSHYDAVLSIVPVHHATESEKVDYLRGALRVLRPGGVLAFAEVEEGSSVHAFLDGFVHEHSRAGHRGAYLSAAFVERMRSAAFNRVSTSFEPVSWHFTSEMDMCAFMTRIFALDAVPANELLLALRS